ncbi:MAG: 30S ribosomal protein S9 [Candidatus Babeliales bacterium]|nr:30S ribosomal protein S9 [Candidatus Babeliales bacterium]
MKANETVTTKKKTTSSSVPASHGVGRRKSSVARVWLRKGTGKMIINGRNFSEYFDTDIARAEATTPFKVSQEAMKFDVEVNVGGGGKQSQAGAIKLGFARALVSIFESLRPVLRDFDLLTVDSRVKERKKYGQKAARRKFQFVKR